MTEQSAEESLRALARDLVEELAAGRMMVLANDLSVEPLDPDSSDPLELASFPVHPFQRQQVTPSGKVVPETVRGHMSERFVEGAPGHEVGSISPAQWQAGQQEWTERGKALAAAHERVTATHQKVSASALPGQRVAQHLQGARDSLAQQKLPDAYKYLAAAHAAGVEDMLTRAQTPEAQAEARDHLDAVQAHMEHLDAVAGLNPNRTRRVVGTAAQQAERASTFRDQHKARLRQGYGTPQGTEAVHAAYREGLLSDAEHKGMAEEAGQAQAARHHQAEVARVRYPQGAGAVYPQAATAVRSALPGGTLSGHENLHRAVPAPAAPAAPPEAAELDRAHKRIEGYARREDQRQKQDLSDHVAEIRAAEAQRRGQAAPGEYAPLTDEQFAARQHFVSRAVEQAHRAGQDTTVLHTIGHRGQTWTPQRVAQQDEVLKDFLDRQRDVPSEHQAVFLGGLMGAGKSTMLERSGLNLRDYANVSPDVFKEELMKRGMAPEVKGLSPMETASLVHEESLELTNLALEELLRRGKNVVWETTMMRQSSLADRVRQLKDAGYHVHTMFADVSPQQSADRVESRYRQQHEAYRKGTNPLGGRHIPRHHILEGEGPNGESRARANFEQAKPQFDSWEHWDTSQSPAQRVDHADAPHPGTGAIPSVERLRRYTGATEQQAHAAETGQEAAGG